MEKIKVEEVENIISKLGIDPVSECAKAKGGINPFLYDSFHMGQQIGKNIYMMMANHPSEEMRYFYLVDTTTGKRFRITIE